MKKKLQLLRIMALAGICFAGGCNLPDPHVLQKTIAAQTAVSAYVQTMHPAAVTETPAPTHTPLPSATPEPSSTPVPTTGPTATPTLSSGYFHGSLWYEPEFISQEGLLYNGRKISTGCTAASVQMVLDFWHNYNQDYATLKAQTLIDQNVWQHRFDEKTGLNILDTEDDLDEIGYYLGVRENSNKEELLTALERYGPLLILTKVNWTPFGANHMAVVTGYLPEKDIIRVLDPWQEGGIMEFPYENFDGIWSLNFLDDPEDTLRRTFFFIVPYYEIPREYEPFIPGSDMERIRHNNMK